MRPEELFPVLRSTKPKSRKPSLLPSSGIGITLIFLGFSWLLHLVSLVSLPSYQASMPANLAKKKQKKSTIKFKVTPKKAEVAAENKEVVEVIQEKTKEKPDPSKSRLGYNDHKTLKETKTKNQPKTKGLDPARAADKVAQKAQKKSLGAEQANKKQVQKPSAPKQKKKPRLLTAPNSKVLVPKRPEARNAYENLLNNSLALMSDEVKAGYQDYIEDDLEIGNAIDLNTQEYRYIGYFTNLRKSIELTWTYPAPALRRGLYGNVHLKFTIDKDGKVSRIMVLDSSGHRILDSAIVDAIELAAPFAPLPQGFGSKINIKGNFRYVLN